MLHPVVDKLGQQLGDLLPLDLQLLDSLRRELGGRVLAPLLLKQALGCLPPAGVALSPAGLCC